MGEKATRSGQFLIVESVHMHRTLICACPITTGCAVPALYGECGV